MHELLLFGQVHSSRHDQVLQILAGVAAMQPRVVLEKHLIFKPTRSPETRAQVGGNQGIQGAQIKALKAQMQGDLFYLQLVGDIAVSTEVLSHDVDSVMGDTDAQTAMNNRDVPRPSLEDPRSNFNPPIEGEKWTLQFRDLPEVAGRRPVTSRLMADIKIASGDPIRFMFALDYTYVTAYGLQGHHLTYQNILILLYRPLRLPETIDPLAQSQSPLDLTSPKPLDPSGTWILQASIRVQDGSKPEIMTKGMNELKAFKDMMKGVVEMEVGDRLALDTRMR